MQAKTSLVCTRPCLQPATLPAAGACEHCPGGGYREDGEIPNAESAMNQHDDEPIDPDQIADVARRAAIYCQMNFPSRWKPGAPAWDAGRNRWLIPVVLHSPS